jgi:hypothetical protein
VAIRFVQNALIQLENRLKITALHNTVQNSLNISQRFCLLPNILLVVDHVFTRGASSSGWCDNL